MPGKEGGRGEGVSAEEGGRGEGVSRAGRGAALLCVVALAIVLAGCDDGCGLGRVARTGVERGGAGITREWLGIGEVDCPDGLVRCRGGVLETSIAARRPSPCPGNPEACGCPWFSAERCAGSCVADGIEAVLPADRAKAQLCAPVMAGSSFARPLSSPAPMEALAGACDGEAFLCTAATVVACRPAPRAVAVCTGGCALDQPLRGPLAEAMTDVEGAALMCAR